ncbi:hypothetical protein pVa21_205 [Vibrio phage pVa-21]|nr:hypothetical protein pVa21_205 [Vibrio phage pVa-21]
MADISGLKMGQVVSFKLHTKLISDIFTNVKVLGIVGYDVATAFEDVAAVHANIYSTLPEGTPENAEDYDYLYVETIDKQRKVVGVPWIKDPISVVDSATIRVTLNNATTSDVEKVRNALNAYGYIDLSIEVLSGSSIQS